jgi:peptidyl-prolyl cis-trans isomerase SurA
MMRQIIFVITLLLLTATAWAQQENLVDGIAAVVDNEIILQSEIEQYLQFNVGSRANLDAIPPAQRDSLRKIILEELIKQKILLAKARADTMVVDTKQVDAELDSRMKTLVQNAGGQDKLEAYYGMPLAKIKRQFRPIVEENMLIDMVRAKKMEAVKVGPGEIDRFWKAYKDSIPSLKDAVCIAHILLQDTLSESSKQAAIHKADSVRALIVAGTIKFEDYATNFSEDPGTGMKGGKLGTTARGELVPEYEAAAYNMKPGEISQPVVSVFGVHLIRLDDRLGEKVTTSHILFKIVPSENDRARTEARADSIIKQVRGGADFAELAREYSADAKTAFKGGDLGCFAPDELPDDFRGPLKGLTKGDLAAPIRTPFGVHVVMVAERMVARPITLEQDYDRIANLAQAKKRQEVFNAWIKDLAAQTYIERKGQNTEKPKSEKEEKKP